MLWSWPVLSDGEAARFDGGESLSPDVADAIERVAQDIATQARRLT
jgi:hypothetical protein